MEVNYTLEAAIDLSRLITLGHIVKERGINFLALPDPEKRRILSLVREGKAVDGYITAEELAAAESGEAILSVLPQGQRQRIEAELGLQRLVQLKPIGETVLRERIIDSYARREAYLKRCGTLLAAEHRVGEGSLQHSGGLLDILLEGRALVTEMDTLTNLYKGSFGNPPAIQNITQEYATFREGLDAFNGSILKKEN